MLRQRIEHGGHIGPKLRIILQDERVGQILLQHCAVDAQVAKRTADFADGQFAAFGNGTGVVIVARQCIGGECFTVHARKTRVR